MLIDNVTLLVKAGNGGNGSSSLLHNGMTFKGGPDGGNGGNGGNIYFQGSNNITDLREFRYKKKILAESGIAGGRQKLFGKNAPHLTIHVPLGTSITDLKSGRVYEITDITRLLLIASGGKGGRGNAVFRSATNQTPTYSEYGKTGQEKKLLLELRLIAEIGLIGLPNAGKSSLLSVLTHATPKIANYPFTTIEPNIGMLGDHPIADIPGLIEGAAHGRGLGAKFLKHIEKTRILVHCIELTENNVEERYNTVRKEFAEFNKTLLEKPEIILLTKTDLVDEKTVKKYKSMFEKKGKQVLTCSVYDQKSIEALKKVLESQLYKNDYTTSISVERSQKEAFDKISRVSEWWAKNFEGNSQKLYDIFTVRFGSGDMYKIKISEFIRDKKIVWQVIESDQTWHEERDEWTGTEIIWEVTKQKDGTRIDMTHKGLIPTSECYDKCKVGWDYLIQKSLFQFLTENKGLPV